MGTWKNIKNMEVNVEETKPHKNKKKKSKSKWSGPNQSKENQI